MEKKQNDKPKTTWEEKFVLNVIAKASADKGLAARLKRADNPDTEYQSWELLASQGVDLEKEFQRLPFATVASAIAKSKADHNGGLTLGRAIAESYKDGNKDGNESKQAKAKLRRLLACKDLQELTRILRNILSLIESKTNQPLNYVRMLYQLRRFHFNSQIIKAQWAQEFYGPSVRPQPKEKK